MQPCTKSENKNACSLLKRSDLKIPQPSSVEFPYVYICPPTEFMCVQKCVRVGQWAARTDLEDMGKHFLLEMCLGCTKDKK